jgi:hypothetical protein
MSREKYIAHKVNLSTGEKDFTVYFLTDLGKQEIEERLSKLEMRERVYNGLLQNQINEYLAPTFERKFLLLLSERAIARAKINPRTKGWFRPWDIMKDIVKSEGFWIPAGLFLNKLVKEGKVLEFHGWYKLPPPAKKEP